MLSITSIKLGGNVDLLEIRGLAYAEIRRAAEFGDGYTAADLAELIDRPAPGVYATLAGLVRAGAVRLGADGVYFATERKQARPEILSVAPSSADFAAVAPPLPQGPTLQAGAVSPDVKATRNALAKAEDKARRAADVAAAWALHVQGLRAYLSAIGGAA
jgi:hypothetical protein